MQRPRRKGIRVAHDPAARTTGTFRFDRLVPVSVENERFVSRSRDVARELFGHPDVHLQAT